MNVGFAGSKHLDERRRRRLAGEANTLKVEAETPGRSDGSPGGVAERPWPFLPKDPLVQLLVPRRWGPVATAAVVGLAICGLTLLAGHDLNRTAQWLGPDLAALFDLSTGRLVNFLSTFLLLLAAQLSVLVWWVRSASPRDFEGRYQVWARAAAVWLTFAFALNTGAHHAFSRTVLRALDGLGLDLWRAEPLFWLVPSGLIGLLLFQQLRRDMRACHVSGTCLGLAAGCCVLAAVAEFWSGQVLGRRDAQTVSAATSLAAHYFVCLAVWLHARHVVYVSADPPEEPARKAKRKKGERNGGGRTAQPPADAVRHDATEARQETAAANSEAGTAASRSEREDRENSARRGQAQATPVEAEETSGGSPAASATPEAGSAASDGAVCRVDGPSEIPKPNLKGLSKRERRKLRKQWRQQQRAARRGQPLASN